MLFNVLSFPSCYIIIKLKGITKFVTLDSESHVKDRREGQGVVQRINVKSLGMLQVEGSDCELLPREEQSKPRR